MTAKAVVVGAGVAQAQSDGAPIVALETTIFSELGLPRPHSLRALQLVIDAVVAGGAVPALTAVMAGEVRCGIDVVDEAVICGPATKMSARDIGRAVAQEWAYGVTTGFSRRDHRGRSRHLGVRHRWNRWRPPQRVRDRRCQCGSGRHRHSSGDHRHGPGAKVFLDLSRTVEHLETAGVPVMGWHCDEFPAFHTVSSGCPLDRIGHVARRGGRCRSNSLGAGWRRYCCRVSDTGPRRHRSSRARRLGR